jgi:hypothetical protein
MVETVVAAKISVWIDCRQCGRVDKPPVDVNVPEEVAFFQMDRIPMTCEHCGRPAVMYLQRTVAQTH